MVKRILLVVDNVDYEQLKAAKAEKSWEQFLVKDKLIELVHLSANPRQAKRPIVGKKK